MYTVSKFKCSFVAAALIAALGIHAFPAHAQDDNAVKRMERAKATIVKVEGALQKTQTFIEKQADTMDAAVVALQRGRLTRAEFSRVLAQVTANLQSADRELTSHESQANFALAEIRSIRRSTRPATLTDGVLEYWMGRANTVLLKAGDAHVTIDQLISRIARLKASMINEGVVPGSLG